MIMEHLIDENIPHSLGEMAIRYFNDNYKKEFWGRFDNFQAAPEEAANEYEMRDALYTFRLGKRFYDQIGNPQLVDHVHKLYWALFDTEIEGIRVDLDLMQKTKQEMGAKIDTYLPKLREEFIDHCHAWELKKWVEEIDKRSSDKGKSRVPRPQFSFTSDAQLRWLLFESLRLPVGEKTKKGAAKVDYDTLVELVEECPQLKTLIEYKEIKNIYSTFVEGLLERVEDERIYPSFNVNGTRNAGRISHSSPNMGNMPKDGPIRNFFMPNPGNCIVGADYSQLEVVIEANLTEDKQLIRIINEGVSKHDITAEGLKLPRDQAKTLNFALQYGAGEHKISKVLNISLREAQDIFKQYWKLYSGVKTLKERVARDIETTNEVVTPFGRKRRFRKPSNEFERAKFDRQAYNALIQGTGADCTNRATWKIAEEMRKRKLGRLWYSVHDEIVTECRTDAVETTCRLIQDHMVEAGEFINLKYPLQAKTYGPLERWAKA
jgi:DNA polymerase-1